MSRRAERLADLAEREGVADVGYATLDSPIGRLLVASTERGVVKVSFPNEDEEAVLEKLAARLSPRVLEVPKRVDAARRQLDEYFEGRRRDFAVPLDWSLMREGFGERVLRATARIPYGRVSTYREVAEKAGNRAATRAAGNALGSNPIPVIVPCHRVLRTGGGLGGYGGGLSTKEFLLRLEGAMD